MSFWQILGRFAVSDAGETLQKLSDTTSVSSDGTTYTKTGRPPLGQMGLPTPRWEARLGLAQKINLNLANEVKKRIHHV
jgi:hypothetical protein